MTNLCRKILTYHYIICYDSVHLHYKIVNTTKDGKASTNDELDKVSGLYGTTISELSYLTSRFFIMTENI